MFVSKYEDAFFEMNRLLRIACIILVTYVVRNFVLLSEADKNPPSNRTTMVYESTVCIDRIIDGQTLSFCQCTQSVQGPRPQRSILDLGAGGRSGNTLASDASGLGSTPERGTLELDTGYHPFGVSEMCSN